MHLALLQCMKGSHAAHRPPDDGCQVFLPAQVFASKKNGWITTGDRNLLCDRLTIPRKSYSSFYARPLPCRFNQVAIGRNRVRQHLAKPGDRTNNRATANRRHFDAYGGCLRIVLWSRREKTSLDHIIRLRKAE